MAENVKEDALRTYAYYASLRDERGITDYKVSNEAGLSRSTLSQWKNGKHIPSFENQTKLAAYFDVPREYFGGEIAPGEEVPQPGATEAPKPLSRRAIKVSYVYDHADDITREMVDRILTGHSNPKYNGELDE